jgi:ribosome-associated toxin RatA of RatAB toxin-antitoxin module
MKYFFGKLLFIGTCCWPFSAVSQEAEWELKKAADGITVYTRSVENSNIKEFKASTKLNSSTETIFKIILDVENYPKWIADIDYAERVYQRENEIGMYYQLGLPWPIKDRDVTLVSKYETLPDNSILFQLSNNSDLKGEDTDFIRIKEIKGQWLIKYLDKENCQVAYQFMADPEGFLPAWVVNIFIVDGPFKTLENLDKYAKDIINQKVDQK